MVTLIMSMCRYWSSWKCYGHNNVMFLLYSIQSGLRNIEKNMHMIKSVFRCKSCL